MTYGFLKKTEMRRITMVTRANPARDPITIANQKVNGFKNSGEETVSILSLRWSAGKGP